MAKKDSHSDDSQNSENAFGRNMAQQIAFEIYRIFATDMTERGLVQLALSKNGKPKFICPDNGPAFTVTHLQDWLKKV
jgi:hypothetical protein